MSALLEGHGITVRFGGLAALKGVDLGVSAGEVLSVIGPNGAGKTTLFNVITGRVRPSAGTVRFRGQPIERLPAFRIAQLGVVRTFQKTEVFEPLPLVEGVAAGALARNDPDPEARAREALATVGLLDKAHLAAHQLSYGDQRLLELAQALAAEPAVLLLDEPASGMNHQESRHIMQLIVDLRARGQAVILVEHNMHVVMSISDRVIVINYGEKIAEGRPKEVRADPKVIQAYLGVDEGAGARAAGARAPATRLAAPATEGAMLALDSVTLHRGRTRVLDAVSLAVGEGELVALIGANGAGKTTVLRTISGILRPSAGTITFRGKPIQGADADIIVRLGIGHCPEERKIWPDMSVREHLELGAFAHTDGDVGADMERIFATFPVLSERRDQLAGTLSGGEQQMLAIGRALMSRPALMLFDEPSLGLAPLMVETIGNIIAGIRDRGTTVLLVEQNASLALRLADRAYVLETGRVTLSGPAREMIENPEVHRAYLGG